MRSMKSLMALAATVALAYGLDAYAAERISTPGSPMKMDDPMPIKMKKPGMKKGDVKKAAEKKEREIAPMIGKESGSKTKQ